MTSHETRSTHTTRTKTSEQNDIKKLKSKYSAKLPTLKVLFSDWSDDDLLFVLDEANGDLDLTIDRISEGHANQWGEVKTKKSKKEAQKAKVATTVVSSHQQQSTTTSYHAPRDTKITTQRSYNERVTRPGKAPVSSSSSRTRTAKNTSWDKPSHQENSSGSWASIASSKQQEDALLNNEESWNNNTTTPTTTTTTNTTTINESSPNDDWSPAPTHNTQTNDESNDDQPKTWASLLKSKPKPESEPVTNTTTTENIENTTTTSEWEAPTTSNDWSAPPTTTDTWNAPNEPVLDEWSTPANDNEHVSTDSIQSEVSEKEVETIEKEQEIVTVTHNRLVNQEEPVVLPSTTTISSLDVKFGSLNVDEEHAVEEIVKETTVAAAVEPVVQAAAPVTPATPSPPVVSTPITSVAPVVATPITTTSPPPASTTTTVPVTTAESFSQSSTYLKQEPVYSQPQQQPQQQQQQPHQQQPHQQAIPHQQIPQQQQQFGMDHLTSAYSSYLPSQPPTGVSGFGMNPMGNLPDYGIYGTEAQRAAAMGYYDPTAFSHSPSVTSASAYQSRDKYSQEANVHGQSAAQNQNMPQQQMYPTNLPYYQYYYMPNQFNAYQQSAYGQPFMNKSMYPTMYQQQQQQHSGKPGVSATAGASPYGASASPYGQQSQLYNHQSASGYDDLNQLSMGLNDYQKPMYGAASAASTSGQGFLGNLSSQQNGQGQQPQQGQAQKSDIRANPSTSAVPPQQQQTQQPQQQQAQAQQAQAQAQAQQQQQQQAYAAAGGNYFGQPQMFSYQQYPQQHHQFQQQMPPQGQSQQPSRQQQYWNQ